jgi:hypothetical protein
LTWGYDSTEEPHLPTLPLAKGKGEETRLAFSLFPLSFARRGVRGEVGMW